MVRLAEILQADGRFEAAIECADKVLAEFPRLDSYFAVEARALE